MESVIEVVTVRGRPFLTLSEEADPARLVLSALTPVSDGDFEEAETALRDLIEGQAGADAPVLGADATLAILANLASLALLLHRLAAASQAVTQADRLVHTTATTRVVAALQLCAAHVEALQGNRERAAARLRRFQNLGEREPRLLVEWQFGESEVAELAGDLAHAGLCCARAWKLAHRHQLDASLVERVKERKNEVVEKLSRPLPPGGKGTMNKNAAL